jgi:hypothetical protein
MKKFMIEYFDRPETGKIYEQRSPGTLPQRIINVPRTANIDQFRRSSQIYELILILQDTFREKINPDLFKDLYGRQDVSGLGTSTLIDKYFDPENWELFYRRARIRSMQLPNDPRDVPEAKGLMLAELEADEKRREALKAMIEKPLTYIGIRPLTFEKVIKERLGLYDIFNQ